MNFKSSKIRWVMALSFALVITLAIIFTTTSIRGIARADSSASGPTIASDQADYSPGSTVTLTGAGWAPNEAVHINVNDSVGNTWSLNSNPDPVADSNGGFTYSFSLPNSFVASYIVTATGPTSGTATTTFTDAGPAGNLDQCANKGTVCDTNHSSQWQNGNLGAQQAIYFEGDSVPYRAQYTGLTVNQYYQVTIQWDTTQNGKHALDYLTTYNRTVATADPCAGITSCSTTTNTLAIPADPNVTGAGVTPISGNFTLFGGKFTSTPQTFTQPPYTGNICATYPCTISSNPSAYTLSGTFSGNSQTSISMLFQANAQTVVLAWGGHIATRADWGANNSAVAINGSPYHMRLLDLTCSDVSNCSQGNQDRGLDSAAVIFPGSITIIKHASPQGATSFPFTASPSPLANFSLVDDGTSSNTKTFSNITNFQTYTVTENRPANWTLTGVACTVSSPNGGAQTVSGATATINLAEGENVTCTYSNSRDIGSLTIKKTLDDGGSGFSGTFTIHYDCGGTFSGDVSVAGGGSATVDKIPTGSSCTVTEPTLPTSPTGYSWGTPVISGSPAAITTEGATVSVTVANVLTRDTGSLQITKTVDAGGSNFTSGSFGVHVDCGTGGTFDKTISYPTPGNVTVTGIPTGSSCAVSEPILQTPPSGYSWGTPTISGSPATIGKNTTVTVDVKNVLTRDTGSLQIIKTVDAGGSNFTSGTFGVHVDCGTGGTFDKTIDYPTPGNVTITGIPTGSSCTVSEPTLPAAPTGYSWDPPTITGSPAVITTKDVTFDVVVKNVLTRDTGSLKISKTLDDGGSGFSGTFNIHVDCGTGGVFDPTIDYPTPGNVTIPDIPTGLSCTVTEPTLTLPAPPTGYSWGTPVITGSPAAITTKDAIVDVTVANVLTRDTGSLKITKTLSDGGSGFKGTFTIHYDCGNSLSGDVSVIGGGSATVNNIPTGSNCTVTEPAQPTAPTGYSWDPPTITGSPAAITTKSATVEVTVKNVLTRNTGSLKISKTLDDGGSGFTGMFTIHYDCGNSLSGDVNVVSSGSATVKDISTGSSCTVTEPTQPTAPTGYSWGTPVIVGSPAAITTKGATVTVDVMNGLTRDSGSLKITKTLDDGGSGFKGTFNIHVNCGTGGVFDPTIDYPTPGNVTVPGIPTGSSCTVTEPTQPTAPTGYSWGTPTISGSPAPITTKGGTVEVTVKNVLTRNTGSLKITKTLSGGPQGFSGTFTIHYDCGNGLVSDVSVVAGGSATVNNIPTGSSCMVTEPKLPTGYSWGPPIITGSPAAITTKGATVNVTVKNRLQLNTGALTMGFWQNKNGQGIISAANQANLGNWLRQYHPFSNVPSSNLAAYVSTIIKNATCASTSGTCNSMLRAQMLATALDVYFSDPALGGNKINAPTPIGGVTIDLTKICQIIDGSGGTATCNSTYENVSSAFGGATSMTVLQMLAYQNTADPLADAGAVWYGQVKATQVLAKDAFDAINNQVVYGP